MKVVKPKKTAPLIIEDVIVDGKKKISVRIESPEDRWRQFLSWKIVMIAEALRVLLDVSRA